MRGLCPSLAAILATLLVRSGTGLAQPAPKTPPPKAPAPETPTPEETPDPAAEAAPRVVAPTILVAPTPVFPTKALDDRVHGVVVVELSITETGTVDGAAVASLTVLPEGGDPRAGDGRYGFADAATAAALQMTFTPATYDGVPFAVKVNYTFRFALPAKPVEAEVESGPAQPARESRVNFKGQLVERGSRSAVPGATVTVYRGEGEELEGFEATSGAEGEFEFFDLPDGEWSVRIERDGYIPVETEEELSLDELVEGRYWIEKGSYNEYDLTVEAERPRKEVSRRSLTVAEISKVPGAISDDPVLVVENLPGVARSGGGEIVVRGSGPADTGVFIDGIGVPLIYHFGGLKSVVPSSVVGGIDFYPGNYSVAYGRAMGGIFDLQLKKLKPDIVHGSADVSILDTSLYLEVPLGDKAAIAFAGRRSYVDFVLDAVVPEDAGIALVTAPRYYDYQVLGNWRPRREHEIRWLGMGSDDLLELLFDDPAGAGPGVAESNDISAHTAFQRIIGDYRYTPSATFSNHLRLSVGRDEIGFNLLGAFQFNADIFGTQLRDTVTWKQSQMLTLEAGVDATLSRFTGIIELPGLPSEGQQGGQEIDPDDVLKQEIKGAINIDVAPFVEAQIKSGRLLLVPGLRMDYFASVDDFSLDPRLSARYELVSNLAIKGGAAVVHQAPQYPEVDPVFGNPELGLQRALQYSAGVEWQPVSHVKGDLTFFYKDLDNLVSPTEERVTRDGQMVPKRYDNEGQGRVYGAEVFIEREFASNLRGWLSYTLSRAERTDSGASQNRLFDYDQTHILAIVASYTLPRNWELGARWRLVSGSPTTPVVGATYNNESDSYTPIYGEVNSGRLPMFQQLDLRVDKTFVYDTWKFAAYLSLVNASNHDNVESLTYNFDYSEQGSVNGLPVLPIFGVKGEW